MIGQNDGMSANARRVRQRRSTERRTEDVVVLYLRGHAGTFRCGRCIARAIRCPELDVETVLTSLERYDDFDVKAGVCSTCRGRRTVIGAGGRRRQ